MNEPFDLLAESYDADFTNTSIGQLQRGQVWKYIDHLKFENKEPRMLELNFGTGEDALYFSRMGFKVIATDVSEKMVRIAAIKAIPRNDVIKVLKCNLLDIGNAFPRMGFDLVFSNFGCLNCIAPQKMKSLSGDISKLLKPNGRFICVVMPRFCIWETLYFLSKFKFKKSFRRWTKNEVEIKFNQSSFPVWYYSPMSFAGFFMTGFKVVSVKPIGFFIPPSYMKGFFTKHNGMLSFLGKMERKIENISFLAGFSDHFLIDLVKAK